MSGNKSWTEKTHNRVKAEGSMWGRRQQCGRASQSGGRRLKTFQVFRFLFVETIKQESVARIKKRSWKMNHNIFDCARLSTLYRTYYRIVWDQTRMYSEYEFDTQERPKPIHNRNNDDMMWSDMFWRRSKLWTNQQKMLRERFQQRVFAVLTKFWISNRLDGLFWCFLSLWWREEGFSVSVENK